MNQAIQSLILAAVAVVAVSFSAQPARAADKWSEVVLAEPFTWNMIGLEYTDRTFGGIPQYDKDGKELVGKPTQSVSQHTWAATMRGTLYSPWNRTALGHTPGINYDLQIGSYSEASIPNKKYAGGEGGFVFGFKTGYPWALYDNSWMRVGAGFGFGIMYHIGILDPANANYQGLDFDGFGTVHADFKLAGSMKVHATYEHAPFNVAFGDQKRVNATFSWTWLAVSLRYAHSNLTDKMTMTNLGTVVGIAF